MTPENTGTLTSFVLVMGCATLWAAYGNAAWREAVAGITSAVGW
jgi:hypothetical protein